MLPEALKDIPAAAGVEQWDAEAIAGGAVEHGQVSIEIRPEKIVEACRFLKGERQFNRLSGITAVDWHPAVPRFEVVYLLHSLSRNERLRLKCRLAGDPAEIESVTGVWKSANWYEREVFDLFGITFRNHPDLRRILMPEDWQGYPLRKDYPVHGHKYSYQNE
jgi:NADH-quinone oxidoreductase subunit C